MNKQFFSDRAFGWNGLHTFIFSNILLLGTLGISYGYILFRLVWVASQSKIQWSEANNAYWVLIAGLRLAHNRISPEFKQRLDRALVLHGKPKFMISGGITGDSTVSEAQAGAEYLLAQGVEESRIIKEEASRHTLENMQFARQLLDKDINAPIGVISSRYHLYRLLVLANSVGMDVRPIAAEERLIWSAFNIMRMIKEAYYLHWFFSGKLWVFITGNYVRIPFRFKQ